MSALHVQTIQFAIATPRPRHQRPAKAMLVDLVEAPELPATEDTFRVRTVLIGEHLPGPLRYLGRTADTVGLFIDTTDESVWHVTDIQPTDLLVN